MLETIVALAFHLFTGLYVAYRAWSCPEVSHVVVGLWGASLVAGYAYVQYKLRTYDPKKPKVALAPFTLYTLIGLALVSFGLTVYMYMKAWGCVGTMPMLAYMATGLIAKYLTPNDIILRA